jgi:hypothetical protein
VENIHHFQKPASKIQPLNIRNLLSRVNHNLGRDLPEKWNPNLTMEKKPIEDQAD